MRRRNRVMQWLLPWSLVLGVGALAQIVSSLPFTLQNNTVADATQVMANFNQIVANVNANGAKNGANNDITSLAALATPLTPAQGGTSTFTGGTSTGTANAQVVATVVPSSFSLVAGNQVTFIAGASNTGAMTLNVASSGVKNVFRRTQLGVSAVVGGEVIAAQVVTAIYDGTQFQLVSPMVLVGGGGDWFTTTAPTGWLLRDGSAVSRTTYATLFSVIGTTYGVGDGSTTFNVPDERGRMSVMKDSASRITTPCAAANTLGTVCGVASGQVTVAQANLTSFTLSDTIGGTVNLTIGGSPMRAVSDASPSATYGTASPSANIYATAVYANPDTATLTKTGSVTSGGTSTGLTILNGSLVVNKLIKY